MAGVVVGRNESLLCGMCTLRVSLDDLREYHRNLLTYFGPPMCPRCGCARMIWERYTVVQLPFRRSAEVEPSET